VIDSKRLATLKALTVHFETEVSIANGYQHDLAGKVFRGRVRFNTQNDDRFSVPMLSILEDPNPDRFPQRAGGDTDYGLQKDQWVLLVQGWSEDDKINPTDPAHALMADVKKALAKLVQDSHPVTGALQHPSYMLGGLISGMTMEPGTVRPPTEQASEDAFFWLRIALQFVEQPNDPYALD